MGQKILIVDDEIDLLDILTFNLEKNGYEILTATSGEEAIQVMAQYSDSVSLVLMDVMMGGIDGFQTAKYLRQKGHCAPIIFLTAKDTESDILQGFDIGADDYISKPFSVRQVVARVKAVLARMPAVGHVLSFENISLDAQNKIASVDGQALTLTKTEFMILQTLLSKSGKIFSREELIGKVWGSSVWVEERTVDVHIARLRKKLGEAGSYIVNRSGYGYELGVKN